MSIINFLVVWGLKSQHTSRNIGLYANGKQGKRYTLAIFAAPPGPQKCLLGLLPKPATSGLNVQK